MNANREAAIERAINDFQQHQRKWLREYLENQYVMHDLKRLNHKARTKRVEYYLKESHAQDDLTRLAQKGCDRRHIVNLLALMDGTDMPPRWLGFRNRAQLKRAVAKLQEGERVVRTVQPNISLFNGLSAAWAWFAFFPILTQLLESYGSFLKFFAESPEAQSDIPRELLVSHVIKRAGLPCDKEVASMIAALPGRGGYSVQAHTKWRSRHDIVSAN
jgi:hypothetical protein